MRNMSFFLTINQIRNHTKTVTRRQGWFYLTPGEIVQACVKCQGLKKGESIDKICKIKIKSVRKEYLTSISAEDCIKEGFPYMNPIEFVLMYIQFNNLKLSDIPIVTRIEFEYL